MKRVVCMLLLILAVSGCTTLTTVRKRNKENLERLSVGMTKSEVMGIMNAEPSITSSKPYLYDKTFIHKRFIFMEEVRNPHHSEVVKVDGRRFEVLYYHTEMLKADSVIADDELIPLVFEEDGLTGWGWSFLDDVKNR